MDLMERELRLPFSFWTIGGAHNAFVLCRLVYFLVYLEIISTPALWLSGEPLQAQPTPYRQKKTPPP